MKKIFSVRNVIILILLLIAILEFINPKGIMPNRVKIVKGDSIPYAVHDTISQEVEVEVEVEVPVKVEVEKRVEVPVIQQVDTNEILKVYFAKIENKDVLKLPNNQGTVTITDTISKNSIVNRKFIADIKKMIVTDTVYTKEPKKTEYFLGFDSKFTKPNVVEVMGLGFIIKDKRDRLYKLDAGVTNQVSDPDNNGVSGKLVPYLGGGVYWRIKSRN